MISTNIRASLNFHERALRLYIFYRSHTANVSRRRRRDGKWPVAKDNGRASKRTDIGGLDTVNSPGNCRRGETYGGWIKRAPRGNIIYTHVRGKSFNCHTKEQSVCRHARNPAGYHDGERAQIKFDVKITRLHSVTRVIIPINWLQFETFVNNTTLFQTIYNFNL